MPRPTTKITGMSSSHLSNHNEATTSRRLGGSRTTFSFTPMYAEYAASSTITSAPGKSTALKAFTKSTWATSAKMSSGSEYGSNRPTEPPVVTRPSEKFSE